MQFRQSYVRHQLHLSSWQPLLSHLKYCPIRKNITCSRRVYNPTNRHPTSSNVLGSHDSITTTSLTLENGLVLRHFTSEELNFLYKEVYVDRVYLQHGVTIRPGDTVVDVGANTGLFTLLAAQESGPSGRVLALEPLVATFELLQSNVAEPMLLNCGAGAPDKLFATFVTYSDSASGWSTMYPNDREVADNMMRYIENLLAGDDAATEGGAAVEDTAVGGGGRTDTLEAGVLGTDELALLQGRSNEHPGRVPTPVLAQIGRVLWRMPPLRPLLRTAGALYVRRMLSSQRQWLCPLVALSSLMAEQNLDRIDMLKVDVERAELDVLSGLSAADWPRVRQLVLEVHDLGGRLAAVQQLLADKGFSRIISEQDARLAGSTIYLVYALRE